MVFKPWLLVISDNQYRKVGTNPLPRVVTGSRSNERELAYATRLGTLNTKCKVNDPAVAVIRFARLFLDQLTYLE